MYRYSRNKEGQEGVEEKRMDVEAADVQTRMGAETTKRMEDKGVERAKRRLQMYELSWARRQRNEWKRRELRT